MENVDTYLAIVPVAHLIFEDLLLLRLQSLADTQPATTDGTPNVADTAFLGKLACDILV